MDQIFILIAFLLGYKLGRDNRIVESGKIENIFNKVNPFKQKTKVFNELGMDKDNLDKWVADQDKEVLKDMEF